jgi:hypothetical protein
MGQLADVTDTDDLHRPVHFTAGQSIAELFIPVSAPGPHRAVRPHGHRVLSASGDGDDVRQLPVTALTVDDDARASVIRTALRW